MITPGRERVAKSRARRRKGLVPLLVEVSQQEIDHLNLKGYCAPREDPKVMAEAVSAFLADSALEG